MRTGTADWVRIEAIAETGSGTHHQLAIRVRPSREPHSFNQVKADHFFAPNATSSFVVEMQERTVTAAVHGRNELPNVGASGLWNKLRNLFISVAAMLGMAKFQWEALVKGVLNSKYNNRSLLPQ
jgi:hypothetical protein